MGSIIDLPSEEWFGDFPDHLRVHIIDSNRPQNLASLFGPDEKIVIWDDGGAEDMEDEKKAWEALAYAPDDDEDSEDDSEDEDEEDEASDDEAERRKRRKRRKRRHRGMLFTIYSYNEDLNYIRRARGRGSPRR